MVYPVNDVEGLPMNTENLLDAVAAIRREPLRVCCRTPAGELIVTTVEDCARNRCRYFHIVADDLDDLLDSELNRRR